LHSSKLQAKRNTNDSHLAPGGYLEHSEILPVAVSDDNTLPEGSSFDRAGKLAVSCSHKAGKPLEIQAYIKDMITKAGFSDVVEDRYKWPVGDWPADQKLKDIGRWNATRWHLGIEAWSMRFLTLYEGVRFQTSLKQAGCS